MKEFKGGDISALLLIDLLNRPLLKKPAKFKLNINTFNSLFTL